ncbi:transcription factor MYB44-like [Triticum dicoccoides]|uniref:transcription factor MYB44-like n=1 Tax=Triticum dicoccoides TaxID=85692 RepID=UPI001890B544|nr:transcription factor MYB44-like [Triticum dicoccoides]
MWTKTEDDLLREQVRRCGGPHNWDAICRGLLGRNSKSCRVCWCQHLDPRVGAVKPFTPEEDMLIVKYQDTYGNRWSTIAEFLSGRTDNAIKNRWNSVLHKHAPSLQGYPRLWAPSIARQAVSPEVMPGCLPLFLLTSGDVRMSLHSTEDVSEAETCPAERECLELFPLAPGDIMGNTGAAASSVMSCGADDPLTELRLWPAARVVFDVMPLQAYRMYIHSSLLAMT